MSMSFSLSVPLSLMVLAMAGSRNRELAMEAASDEVIVKANRRCFVLTLVEKRRIELKDQEELKICTTLLYCLKVSLPRMCILLKWKNSGPWTKSEFGDIPGPLDVSTSRTTTTQCSANTSVTRDSVKSLDSFD
jgi:hypothetical protein